MKKNTLGRTGIEIPDLCLGTMTYGNQTEMSDSHRQMDMATAAGINFFDVAEMYPVNPPTAETSGRSEEHIGAWFEKSGRRKDVILATKHSGEGLKFIRDGAPISSKTIPSAIEGSLKRLKTDYIDLYQFHWPNRGSYMFRQNWTYAPSADDRQETVDNMLECLEALQKEIDRGTIRAFGLSNESTWGAAQWLRISEDKNLPRVATVQNEYSLMCRLYDTDMAEMSMKEDVGLLAFSPLAAGLLTGKYQNGAVPEKSRMSIVPQLGGRKNDRMFTVVQAYLDIAQANDLDPIHMALAWCRQRPFLASAIFGATNSEQLSHVIEGKDLILPDELMREIDVVHRQNPMPY